MIKPLLKAAKFDHPGLNALVVVIAISISVTVGLIGYQYLVASATSARLYLSPDNASVEPGGNLAVDVRADSGGELVNAVQVNVTYPTDKLQYEGYDAEGGPFEIQAAAEHEPGVISIARGTTSPLSGDFKVLSLRFTAMGNGKAVINLKPSSALVRTSDASDVLTSYGLGVYTIKPN